MIEDGMTSLNFLFTGETNQTHNSFKTTINIHDKESNETSISAVVCLQDNECKFFEKNKLDKADFAYNNGEFAKQRSKRNVVTIGKYVWDMSAPVRSPAADFASRAYQSAKVAFNNWGNSVGKKEGGKAMDRANNSRGQGTRLDRSKH